MKELFCRLFLKEFCMKFLEHAYNNLLRLVKVGFKVNSICLTDFFYFTYICFLLELINNILCY